MTSSLLLEDSNFIILTSIESFFAIAIHFGLCFSDRKLRRRRKKKCTHRPEVSFQKTCKFPGNCSLVARHRHPAFLWHLPQIHRTNQPQHQLLLIISHSTSYFWSSATAPATSDHQPQHQLLLIISHSTSYFWSSATAPATSDHQPHYQIPQYQLLLIISHSSSYFWQQQNTLSIRLAR